jgi:hypothetical protein
MFEHNSCPGTLVFPTGVSIVLLSEMTIARTSFVILEKDHALIERRSLVHELLLRLTVNRVTERRGRTRQIPRKTNLVEKQISLSSRTVRQNTALTRCAARSGAMNTSIRKGQARPASREKSWITPKLQELNAKRKTLANCYGKEEPECRANGTGARASARRR